MSENNEDRLLSTSFAADIATVGRIAAVPTILDVVCRITGMGFAAVARVTEDRWIACSVKDDIAFGLTPGGELKVETTICHEIRQNHEPVVINHVAEDEHWRRHHTPLQYGFQSYISMPIIMPDGQFFGTLCAIDPRPARVNTPEIVGMFRMFAELIAFHLDAQGRLETSQTQLDHERETAALREQFIAVLGHDLRNPLAAIHAGIQQIKRTPLDAKASGLVTLVQRSATRMASLIDNLMDLARGRFGGGLSLNLETIQVEPVLEQVIEELRTGMPDSLIQTEFDLANPVQVDGDRIAQLFSNLLANALTHGAPGHPVRVAGLSANGIFSLSIANAGKPIDPVVMARLFQPFFRGESRMSQQGLGLGLYISEEIARAHGGVLTVSSDAEETRFTLTIPAS